MTEEIILNTSDEAAQYRTDISGWVSREGLYFGKNENAARYAGCTHVLCSECGRIIPKGGYTVCKSCRDKKDVAKYAEMERVEWNGTTPLYSRKLDIYLSGSDPQEYADLYGCTVEELRLVLCEPVYLRQIDDDFGYNELPEDGKLPDEVLEAIENLNQVIRDCGPVSWTPGNQVPIGI